MHRVFDEVLVGSPSIYDAMLSEVPILQVLPSASKHSAVAQACAGHSMNVLHFFIRAGQPGRHNPMARQQAAGDASKPAANRGIIWDTFRLCLNLLDICVQQRHAFYRVHVMVEEQS